MAVVEAESEDVYLYLGGQLVMGEISWEEEEKIFNNIGSDKVYPPNAVPDQVIADLEADLKL